MYCDCLRRLEKPDLFESLLIPCKIFAQVTPPFILNRMVKQERYTDFCYFEKQMFTLFLIPNFENATFSYIASFAGYNPPLPFL